jgi:multidrug efflux pump
MLITNYAIKFRTAVVVFVIVMVLLGSITYMTLPREGSPDITIPYVFVTAVYEGTAPEEMENLVTIPMEKKLNDLENVKEMSSTSSEGITSIVIEFLPTEDIDMAKQKVKDKIDLAKPDLPDDLDEPAVEAINFSTDMPILMFALSGDPDLERLNNLAEDLQDQIEALPGAKQAAIYGTREREIRVEIDLNRVIAYQIPLSEVSRVIAMENSTVSAGNLEMTGGKFQVRIPGEFTTATEMKDLVVAVRDGKPIFLTDIASITDTYKDLSSISRLNGEPCVSIHVKKRSGVNTVSLIRDIKKLFEQFQLPQGIKLTITRDESQYISDIVKELENNIFSGFVLVVVIILMFMGWRNSIFVGLAIPLSMLLSFVVMSLMGLTLNMIVLFSLVLAVGMLVDNAIVIIESIYRNRTLGLSRIEASRRGASEVAWPVITSTLTTLVAFWPLLYWPDIIGQFMSFLPITLIITLTASLFVGIVVNPALASIFIHAEKHKVRHDASGEIVSSHWFVEGYERFLRGALQHRGVIMLLGFALLVLGVQAYARFGRGVELFPNTEPRSATIEVKFPQGTPIEKTDAVMRGVEEKLKKYEDIKFTLTNVGATSGRGMGIAGTHVGVIDAEFLPADERKENTTLLVEEIREEIGSIPGAEVKVDREKEGPPTGAPVSIELAGEDFETLSRLSGEIKRAIEDVPGLVDLQDNLEEALPELQFRVDRQRAALLGLDTATIGRFLRSAIYGAESSKFRAGEDEYDITVRLPVSFRQGTDLLAQVFIPLPNGQSIPLSSLGQAVYTGGRGDIMRKNQKRVITISGDIQQRSIDAILRDIRVRVAEVPMPRGYGVTYSGENKDMKESGAFLLKAFGFAVAMIAVILVIQFNSVVYPAIIMVSVVLSLIGVMWGLLICQLRFGVIMTGLGVISLAGVVVNNAIVLIDCVLQRRKEGMTATEAVVTAGRLRLRPVLLTAGTTVLGLIPMAVGWSVDIHTWPWKFVASAESGTWWAPMAVAVIFGLTLATVLTLVVVPVMYSLAESFSHYFRRFDPTAHEDEELREEEVRGEELEVSSKK